MKFLTALIICLTASLAGAEKYSAAIYTPTSCLTILKDGAVVESVNIRGRFVEKIKAALSDDQLGDFTKRGVQFRQEPLVPGPNGQTVDFKKSSFATIVDFFNAISAGKAVPENIASSLEGGVMTQIGAVVYGKAAETIYVLSTRGSEKTEWQTINGRSVRSEISSYGGVQFISYTTFSGSSTPDDLGTIIDLRGTTAAELARFLDRFVGENIWPALPYAVRDWAIKARGFLLEAKERDTAAPPKSDAKTSAIDELYKILAAQGTPLPPALVSRISNMGLIFTGNSSAGKQAPTAGAPNPIP